MLRDKAARDRTGAACAAAGDALRTLCIVCLACEFTGFLLTIFLVSGMDFPVSLQKKWRGKRFNS